MNNLQIFNNEVFGQIQLLIDENKKEWFPATDIALMLGYSNPQKAIRDHCKEKGCTIRSVQTNGGNQNKKFIDEGNLYRLITHSNLKLAEKFETWIFDEVIPSIRKHGAYMTENTIEKALTNPDFLIQLATNLKEEQEKRKLFESQLEEQKPKVLFADAVSASHTSILVGDLAKLLKQNGVDIGANRLFAWLREYGYLIKRKGTDYNMPTQKSMDLGLFEVKETSINHSDGHISISKTPKVTGKGQIYFINKFQHSLADEEIACTN